MGTASFSVGNVDSAGTGGGLSSQVRTSGAYTTSTSATNLEDASGDISLLKGEALCVHASEAMRIRFGGTAATASTGHYIAATEKETFICREAGTVSIIDVA